MKMKILSGLLILAVAGNIILFVKSKSTAGNVPVNSTDNNELAQLQMSEANTKVLQQTMQQFMIEQFTNDGVQLPDQIKLSGGEQLTTGKLLPASHHVLVFLFDRNACSACVEHELTNIAALKDQVHADDVVILSSSFNTLPQAQLYMERFKVPYKVYNIADTLGFTTEQMQQPCYFVLDNTKKTSLFFMPDKNNPSLSDSYLQIVRKRFFHY